MMDTITVVLVDDHAGVRDGIRASLADLSRVSVIGEAESIASATEMIRVARPRVVVLDLHLPDGSGLQVLRTVKQLPVPPLVIILSNMSLTEYREACLRAGADHVLDKSHEFTRVREIIDATGQICFPSH